MAAETVAIISLAITAAAAGVGTYSAVAQGNAAEDAAKRQQEAENANAAAAHNTAALEAGQIRRRNLLRLGTQRANAAKAGVQIEDSAADVIYDTSIQGELEALSALYSGNTSAAYYQSRGRNAAFEGSQAKSASYIDAGSSLIGGLGRGVGNYRDYKKDVASRNPSFAG